MDDPRIDLSALDPAGDPAQFDRMVRDVLARSEPPRHPLAAELAARGPVAILAAAVLAAAAWIPVAVRRGAEASAAASDDAVTLVSSWAAQGSIPAGADVVRILGE